MARTRVTPAQFNPVYAEVELPSTYSITSNNTFENTGLSMTLPTAGTYEIGFDCRIDVRTSASAPGWGSARLYDATLGAEISGTNRMCSITEQNTLVTSGTGSCTKFYTVTGETTINLQASRNNSTSWTSSSVVSNVGGNTFVRYRRIA